MAGDGALAGAVAATAVVLEPTRQVFRDPDSELPLCSPNVGATTPTLEFVDDVGASRGRYAVFGRPDPDRLAPEDDTWLCCRKRGFRAADNLHAEVVGRAVTQKWEGDGDLLASRAYCCGLGVALSHSCMFFDEGQRVAVGLQRLGQEGELFVQMFNGADLAASIKQGFH